MKIIGITTARNEEDIIEAFARHTLKVCHELLIINHGSTDSTLEILQSLQREGLPVTVVTDNSVGELQSAHMNRLMHMAVNEFAADWVVCVDADEFIQGPLVEFLQKQSPHDETACYRIRLVNYRALPGDLADTLNPVERMTHCEVSELRPDSVWTAKVLFSRALALKEGAFLGKGNHQFLISGLPFPAQWVDTVSLAHYCLRSPNQFGNKVVSRVLQKYSLKGNIVDDSDYCERHYRELRNSHSGFVESFYETRASWVSSVAKDECLIHHPAEYLGGELRYTPNQRGADSLIRNIIDLAENFALSSPSQPSGKTGDTAPSEISLSLWSSTGIGSLHPRTYPVDSPLFTPMHLPLEKRTGGDRIDIEIGAGTGVIEIDEITVKYEDGHSQTIRQDGVRRVLSVNRRGLRVCNSAFVKILVGRAPIHVTLSGADIFSHGAPTDLIFSARLLTDPQRMVQAVFNDHAISQISEASISDSRHRNRYILGEELFFGDSGDGDLFLRSGWLTPQKWGVWCKGTYSSISFRLNRRTKNALSLRIQLRRRKGARVKLGINVDQKRVRTLALEEDDFQWIEIEIPADQNERSELHLSFHVEGPEGCTSGVGIKRIILEELTPA